MGQGIGGRAVGSQRRDTPSGRSPGGGFGEAEEMKDGCGGESGRPWTLHFTFTVANSQNNHLRIVIPM